MSSRDDPHFYKALVDFDPEAIARIEGTPALDKAQHEANKLDREQHKNQPGCLGAVEEIGRAKTEPEDQPMPVVNDAPFIHDLVAEDARWSNYTELARDIEARGELGKRRYGTKLQANNGRLSAKDAYEELLDAACYLRQVFEETRDVKWHARYQEVLVLAGAVRRSLPM